ncbi:hypothetical protein O1611_g8850 [Lasiodiplodia mahajangana]|uniref:Uncharacterized protein n=1 Tax=Lasiodiplodia mahajangana TaxID=1108764 RepID=A0ACC2JBC1_9PEZI|nr:hypothetical protein O1611_g8850 [Lasiodiplodia mahajangana]
MPRKVMIFAGAPEAHTLDWTAPNLLNHFLEPIACFGRLEALPESSMSGVSVLSTPYSAVWRSIPLHQERLRTGFSQTHSLAQIYQGSPGFFNTLSRSFGTASNLSGDKADERVINQFYDHSIAIHGDIPSSQLPSTTSFTTDESSYDITDGLSEGRSIQVEDSCTELNGPQGNEIQHLSDLEDLPAAKYLLSISPQTMTVNIIVGIISIAEPRTIKTRWGATESLVELLVADETKSGFSITFWMSSKPSEANTLVRSLRRQDIILLQNVALSVFMNKVHGHSLRKGHTKISLLHRKRLGRDDTGGIYSMRDVSSTRKASPQLAKTREVWEWLLHFVGDGGTALGKRRYNGKPTRRWDLPPEDTQ